MSIMVNSNYCVFHFLLMKREKIEIALMLNLLKCYFYLLEMRHIFLVLHQLFEVTRSGLE